MIAFFSFRIHSITSLLHLADVARSSPMHFGATVMFWPIVYNQCIFSFIFKHYFHLGCHKSRLETHKMSIGKL